MRSRSIISAPSRGGKLCPELKQTWQCNSNTCPIDCIVAVWGVWGGCSTTCGGGVQARRRSVLQAAAWGGQLCSSLVDERACETATQCPSDCSVSAWKGCSPCSRRCGGGTKRCQRSVVKLPVAGGLTCPSLSSAAVPCNTKPCPTDCELAAWSGWSACTESCSGGSQYRARRVVVRARNGGRGCPGPTHQARACNTSPCPVDCELTGWGAWGACSRSCDAGGGGGAGGQQRRVRSVAVSAAWGGKLCYLAQVSSEAFCFSKICLVVVV